jgi:hypothetical protein
MLVTNLSSHLLSKNLQIKIQTIILRVSYMEVKFCLACYLRGRNLAPSSERRMQVRVIQEWVGGWG